MTITNQDKVRIIEDHLTWLNSKLAKVDLMVEKNTVDGVIQDSVIQLLNKEKAELMLQVDSMLTVKASLN
jgi:hydrogenase maturation factor HypE